MGVGETFQELVYFVVAAEEQQRVGGIEGEETAEGGLAWGEQTDAFGRGIADGRGDLRDGVGVGLTPVEAEVLLLAEEEREVLGLRAGQEEGDDAIGGVGGVAFEGVADFALHPALDAGFSDQDDEVGGGLEGGFEGALPGLAGGEVVEVKPGGEASVAEELGDLGGGGGLA